MPQIRPITDLRNTNEISEIYHKVTLKGIDDLALYSRCSVN
jgi:hypothetical protein